MGWKDKLASTAKEKLGKFVKPIVEDIKELAGQEATAKTVQQKALDDNMVDVIKVGNRPEVQKRVSSALSAASAKAEVSSSIPRKELSDILEKADISDFPRLTAKLNKIGAGITDSELVSARAKAYSKVKKITPSEAEEFVKSKGFVDTLNEAEKNEFRSELRKNRLPLESRIKNAYQKKILQPHLVSMASELMGANGKTILKADIAKALKIDPQDIEKAFQDGSIDKIIGSADSSQTKYLARMLTKRVISNRVLARKNFNDDIGLNTIEQYFTSVPEVVSILAGVAKKNGDTQTYNAAANFYKYMNDYGHVSSSTRTMSKKITDEFSKHDDRKRRDIVEYIKNKNAQTVDRSDPDGVFKWQLDVDDDLAKSLGLNDEEVMMANKIENMFGIAHKGARDRFFGKFDGDEYESLATNVDKMGSTLLFKDSDLSFGTVGHLKNYFPIIASDDYREKVVNLRKEKDPISQLLKSDRFLEQQYGFYKSRRTYSKLAETEEINALDPVQTIDMYFKKYNADYLYNEGRNHIEVIKRSASKLDPTGVLSTTKDEYRDLAYSRIIKGLEEQWSDKTATAIQPSNALTKSIAGLADAQVAYILGLNPRMQIFNFAQYFISGQFKPFMESVKALYKTPSIYKEGTTELFKRGHVIKELATGSAVATATEAMIKKIPDQTDRYVLDRYFRRETPDVMQHEIIVVDGHIRKLFNIATTSYQASDIASRSHAALATAHFVKKTYNMIGPDDLMNGSKDAENRLARALHLDRFNELDKDYVRAAIKNPLEFTARYVERATRQELFNYSKMFTPQLIDKAAKHWFTARMARFMSWPMHYTNYLRAVERSYRNGDREPAKALAASMLLWYGTFTAVNEMSDSETISKWALYGRDRAPLIGPVKQTFGLVYGDRGGMLTAPLSLMVSPIYMANDAFNSMFGLEKDFDYNQQKVYDSVKRVPLARDTKDVIDFLNDF